MAVFLLAVVVRCLLFGQQLCHCLHDLLMPLLNTPVPPRNHNATQQQQQGPGYEGKKLVGSLDAEKRFFDFDKLAEVRQRLLFRHELSDRLAAA